ncbi:MAG: hypothetical protein A2170_07405 [Deltaproteobacteria bacterium RBG_13_53_10]|nr:MAG: hypothetical protein A2170_07405 [Deltaproteobacteria bacterium RBG_13_53_10]
MKCPNCGESLPSLLCPNCKAEIPDKSHYCCWCGHPIEIEEKNEFQERVPCGDGSCIGTINEEGICTICKRPCDPAEQAA